MGLVIAPDIWSLRPLYDDMVARLAREWNMAVCAVEPFPGRDLPPEIEPRMAAVASLDDASHLRDLHEAADASAPHASASWVFAWVGCIASSRRPARDSRASRVSTA